jgi:hypothetical protein
MNTSLPGGETSPSSPHANVAVAGAIFASQDLMHQQNLRSLSEGLSQLSSRGAVSQVQQSPLSVPGSHHAPSSLLSTASAVTASVHPLQVYNNNNNSAEDHSPSGRSHGSNNSYSMHGNNFPMTVPPPRPGSALGPLMTNPVVITTTGAATTSHVSPGPPFPMILSTAATTASGGIPIPIPFMQAFPFPAPIELDPSTAHTHPAFRGRKLRAGKWLEEEEQYADLLIALFDQGQLADCVHGMTLRAYLSQKLHCAPMRISKKYAGKGIGKLVYNAKSKSSSKHKQNEKSPEERAKQLQEAQDKFTRAAVMCVDQVCIMCVRERYCR